jgi:hypothetical protein
MSASTFRDTALNQSKPATPAQTPAEQAVTTKPVAEERVGVREEEASPGKPQKPRTAAQLEATRRMTASRSNMRSDTRPLVVLAARDGVSTAEATPERSVP